MGVGRFFCVALPLLLVIASIVATLIAVLAGVVHENLSLFSLDLEDLTINDANFENIASSLGVDDDLDKIGLKARADIEVRADNITASALGLADKYDITLWGYCYKNSKGKKKCSDHKFDWADSALNTTFIEDFGSAAGVKITLPKEIKSALKTFKTVMKWTEIAFIIALVALGIEFVVGIFANFTRIISCLTWLIAGVAALLTCASATLATVTAAVVVGAVESTAKFYGVKGTVGTKFLATIWIGAAFAIAATLFWIFTICCCKPEHRSSRRDKHRSADGEKLLPTGGFTQRGYAPLSNEHEMTSGAGGAAGSYYNPTQPQFDPAYDSSHSNARYPAGNGRSDLAYEPYSHRA